MSVIFCINIAGPGKANNNSWDITSVLTAERSYLQLNTSWKVYLHPYT